MARIAKLKGMNRVLGNLRRERAVIATGVAKGLYMGGLHLQRVSQRAVPVDTGNLKGSAFTRQKFLSGGNPEVTVGYTANYALFVHEAPMKLKGRPRPRHQNRKGRRSYFWDPQGRATNKFLERPAREERKEITQIVRTTARNFIQST